MPLAPTSTLASPLLASASCGDPIRTTMRGLVSRNVNLDGRRPAATRTFPVVLPCLLLTLTPVLLESTFPVAMVFLPHAFLRADSVSPHDRGKTSARCVAHCS